MQVLKNTPHQIAGFVTLREEMDVAEGGQRYYLCSCKPSVLHVLMNYNG